MTRQAKRAPEAQDLPPTLADLRKMVHRFAEQVEVVHGFEIKIDYEYCLHFVLECGEYRIGFVEGLPGEGFPIEAWIFDDGMDHKGTVYTVDDLVREIVWLTDGARPVEDREGYEA